jgi:predicted transcriptional regulator of viral defense system
LNCKKNKVGNGGNMNDSGYLDTLVSQGLYHFTAAQIQSYLGSSSSAVRAKLRRLKEKKLVAEPTRGFFVIVPPEFRRQGCPPALYFIHQLMEFFKEQHYYVCLLSAAAIHGAAHQQPQVFTVMLEKNRRDTSCENVCIRYFARGNLSSMPVSMKNSPWSTFRCSTPEVTALEVFGYPGHSGGLDNAATVALELAESINPQKLIEAAKMSPVSWSQRLGYILETFGEKKLSDRLHAGIESHASGYIPLRRASSIRGAKRSRRWKLLINAEVEPDV